MSEKSKNVFIYRKRVEPQMQMRKIPEVQLMGVRPGEVSNLPAVSGHNVQRDFGVLISLSVYHNTKKASIFEDEDEVTEKFGSDGGVGWNGGLVKT